MKRSPENKMITSEDERQKGEEVRDAGAPTPGTFYFPEYGFEVQAATREEAEEKAREIISNKSTE